VWRPAFSIRLAAACAVLLFARLCSAQIGAVTLISPADNTTITTATPTLEWAAYPGAVYYTVTLYVFNAAGGESLVFEQYATQNTQATVSPALQAGQFEWQVSAYNSAMVILAQSAWWYFTVVFNPPVLSTSKTHTGNFTQGQAGATYTVTVSNAASAGPTSGTVTVTETIPAGLTLVSMAGTGWTCAANACTRSDALAAGASYPPITVTVNVATNATSPQVNAVSVSGGGSGSANATDSTTIVGALTVTCSAPPNGTVGTPYSWTTCTPSGGTAPYAWNAPEEIFGGKVSGLLPPGLSLNSSTGVVSGTPTTAGSYGITLTITDSSTPAKQTFSQQFTIIINSSALTATCSTPPSGTVGTPYSWTTCTPSGGTAPYAWSWSGTTPPGLSISSSTGIVSGTPTTAGSYPVTLTVKDSSTPAPETFSQQFTIIINPSALTVTCSAPPNGTVGTPYSSATCTASGGTTPYTWSWSGTIPPGLSINSSSGAISGTPTTAGSYPVTVTVTDSTTPTKQTASTTITINISAATVTVSCNPQSGNYAAGASYSATCSASGGTSPYTWSFSSLPSWLKSSGTSGTTITLSGTVPAAPPSSYSLTVTLTDSTTPTKQTASTTVTINVLSATLIVICTPASGNYTAGVSYSATCTASGGTSPYTWSFSNLPSWLKSSGTSGTAITLSGTVPAPPPSSYSLTVTVTDSTTPTKQTASTTVTINVLAATLTVICTPASGNYTAGVSYSATCTASGGTSPYTWSFSSLPSWLKSSGTSGAAITLSGTVPAAPPSSYSLTVTVTDSAAPTKQTASTTVTINVLAATLTVICTPASGNYTAGVSYSATCTASGGTSPYTWSFSSLPSWLKSSGTSGAAITLSGTVPAAPPSSYSLTVTVTDSAAPTKQTASTTVTINVLSTPQLSCNPASGPVMVGIPYTAICAVSGGVPGYIFSLSAGSLPSGLTPAATATTYTISGLPAAPVAYSYTVQVKDSAGQLAAQSFSGTISPAPSVGSFTLPAVVSVANQYTTNLTLSSAPPTTLSGTLCLTFSASPSVVSAGSYQTQEVVFANGTTNPACSSTLNTTLAFTVPAGSTAAVWSGSSSQFSQGTVAGTITVTMNSLVDPSGNSVLPSPPPSQTITVAVGAPALAGSPTLTVSSSSVTVVFDAVTPTRSVTGATYVFNPGSSQPMTATVSFTSGPFAGDDQSQWFGTPASLATGGSFSLSATFSCSNCSALTGVQVTLTN
jgi:hypothetical protein